jgi:DNA polymerase III subunit delta'
MARAPAVTELEEIPAPDVLEGFLHPRFATRLYGHDAAERTLLDAIASGRMHHAWLFNGPEGIGKATLAYRLVMSLLSGPAAPSMFEASLDPTPDHPAVRQIRAQAHPDLFVLRRPYDVKAKKLRTEIAVDEVRRMKSFLQLRGDEGQWRAVIVDPADELNLASANALLKALEEPPPQTIFILVCAAPSRLLPTIRSRCRTLELPPLGADALKKAVTQAIASSPDQSSAAVPTGSDWAALEALSQGRVRRALSLMSGKGFELNDKIQAHLAALPVVDWGAIHSLSDDLGSLAADVKFQLFFDLLLGTLSRLIRAAAAGEMQTPEGKLAARLIPQDRLSDWAELWQAVVSAKAETEALNLDRKALILKAFARLEHVSGGAARRA